MPHNEHWDGPEALETSGEVRGPRHSNRGCMTILLLMGILSLGLAYPWFGIAFL